MNVTDQLILTHIHRLMMHAWRSTFNACGEMSYVLEQQIMHTLLYKTVVIDADAKTAVYVCMNAVPSSYPSHKIPMGTMIKSHQKCARECIVARVLTRLAIEEGAILHAVDHQLGEDIVTYVAKQGDINVFQVSFFKVN